MLELFSYNYQWFLNILGGVLDTAVFYFIITKFAKRKKPLWLAWGILLLVIIIEAWVGTYFTYDIIEAQGSWSIELWTVGYSVAVSLIRVFVYHYIFFGISKRVLYFLSTVGGIITAVMNRVGLLLLLKYCQPYVDFSFDTVPEYLFFTLLPFLIGGAFTVVFIFVISKLKFFEIIKEILEYPNFCVVVAILLNTLDIVFEYFISYQVHDESRNMFYMASYMIFTLFLFFLSKEQLSKEKIRRSETLILQQQAYVTRLEDIQNKLRGIHHDYKNVAAGLYLQAQEGDIEAVKEFVSEKLLQIDKDIQGNIRQMNQLSKIEMIELKSLILTKTLEAGRLDIHLEVEVLHMVKTVNMSIQDLLRCVGVLLDNAIEATAKTTQKSLTIALLQENEKLTLMVKNPVNEAVDMNKIWEVGYSTKGENRGLGLASLQDIVKRHDNLLQETKVEQGIFTQILMVE